MLIQGRSKSQRNLVKFLHITMIVLCLLASIVLYNSPTFFVKLIISLLLIAYTILLITNSGPIKSLLKITDNQKQQNYRNLRIWQNDTSKEGEQQQNKRNVSITNSNINYLQRNNQNESVNNVSYEKSFEKSVDIKNMSMSVYKSLNQSGFSQSRLRKSKRGNQIKGIDLSEAFIFNQNNDSSFSTQKTEDMRIVLLDSQSFQSNYGQNSNRQREILQYQIVLKNMIKKDMKYMSKRYELLLIHIQKTVKSLLQEHNYINGKIKQLAQQFFDITIVDSDLSTGKQSRNYQNSNKMCYYSFIQQLLLLYQQKITFAKTGFLLRKDKRWSSIQPRIYQFIRTMFKLSDTLGVDQTLIKSRFKENTKIFVTSYRNSIEMLQKYKQDYLGDKNKINQVRDCSKMVYQSKCRTYVLYIMVRSINLNLKLAGKIKFNDHLDFKYPHEEKFDFQIVRKAGTEGYLVHFDLALLDEGKQKKRVACEPGEKNYLSVLFFLIFELSKKQELLSWNFYIKGLVNNIL